jgi:hypothetical protein
LNFYVLLVVEVVLVMLVQSMAVEVEVLED